MPFIEGPYAGINFNGVNNKDAVLFPVAIPDASGKPAVAMIHRPLFPGTDDLQVMRRARPSAPSPRECMWISYCPVEAVRHNVANLCRFTSHHLLAAPSADWESLKIGGGTPPLSISGGWQVIYHGVSELSPAAGGPVASDPGSGGRYLRYSAGVMVLDSHHPQTILYRSPVPILTPELPMEREGVVANVVFPTGVDRRLDLGTPNRVDVYYGMADCRIGAACLELPEHLPAAEGLPRERAADG